MQVDISNHKEIYRLLILLDAHTIPLWGKMKAQQMVEHLIGQVRYTNGKLIPYCELPAEEAYRLKTTMLGPEGKISRNVVRETLPETYEFAGLNEAVKALMNELAVFETYFSKPGQTAIHGAFGAMDYSEWLIWHGKHFTHHFKQFWLIP